MNANVSIDLVGFDNVDASALTDDEDEDDLETEAARRTSRAAAAKSFFGNKIASITSIASIFSAASSTG